MRIEDIIKWGLVGGVLYFAYSYLKKNPVVNATSDVIADFYTWLTLPPAMVVQGNISFPDGSLVALADVDVRQKGNMVVANYLGHFYQLFPSDSNGNWPAVQIS